MIEAVVVEPHVGGRWFERGTVGVECPWERGRPGILGSSLHAAGEVSSAGPTGPR